MIVAMPQPQPPPNETLHTRSPARRPAKTGGRSTRLRVTLALVTLTALGLALFYVTKLQPRTDDPVSFDGTATTLASRRAVLAVISIRLNGWREGQAVEVEAVPGASVTAAWLLPPGSLPNLETVADPGPSVRDTDLAARLMAGSDVTPTPLPAPLRGPESRLVILWRIDRCADLSDDVPVRVKFKSRMGLVSESDIGTFPNPARQQPVLDSTGVCHQ